LYYVLVLCTCIMYLYYVLVLCTCIMYLYYVLVLCTCTTSCTTSTTSDPLNVGLDHGHLVTLEWVFGVFPELSSSPSDDGSPKTSR
jgi:hypothetical protein